MVTPKSPAAALGTDDIDGTMVEEKIYHDAGATAQGLRRNDLVRLIGKQDANDRARHPLSPGTRTRNLVYRVGVTPHVVLPPS